MPDWRRPADPAAPRPRFFNYLISLGCYARYCGKLRLPLRHLALRQPPTNGICGHAIRHHPSIASLAMPSCEHPTFLPNSDVIWIDAGAESTASSDAPSEFSISELAAEFSLTPRTLRFYESRGLLSPTRSGGMRLYGRSDRARLALILKAKKYGFTLLEIKEMIEAQDGRAEEQSLKLSREKCSEQISMLERQLQEVEGALAELRRIHTTLAHPAAER
jgi:DNA-binding transcriptional MerR regulator